MIFHSQHFFSIFLCISTRKGLTRSNGYLEVIILALDVFLAHLSWRLICWAYRIGRPPSSSSSSTLFKHLLLRNHWANQSQISYGASMGWGNESLLKWSWWHDKMAAMAICGKNLKKSSSPEPKGQWPWILVCILGCLSTTKFAQIMTLGWTWLYYSNVKFGPLCFCMGKR